MYNPTYADAVIYAGASERAVFIRRTYAHLALAVMAFIVVEWMLLQSPIAAPMARAMTGGFSWLIVLAAFMGVSWLAERWANSDTSPGMQYLGLGLFVVAEAVIFLPLLFVAASYSDPTVIPMAGMITGFLFASAAILYDTSQVLHHYRADQHVAAALSLFASVALLFWYVLRIVMSLSSDDD